MIEFDFVYFCLRGSSFLFPCLPFLPDQVPKAVVQERYERLTELQERISGEENAQLIGTSVEVLVAAGEGRRDGVNARMSGRAEDNRLVHFDVPAGSEIPRPGDVVSVVVTRSAPHFLIAAPVGDDPLIHRALLAYASDMGLLSTTLMPHGMTWDTPGLFSTSLDHAMWFHDDIRVDEWFVYVMDSDWSAGGRGINRGRIYRRDGTLIASAVQEGLIRYDPSATG